MIILKNDLFYFFTKLKKINFSYALFLIFMIIVSYVTCKSFIVEDSYNILGLNFDINSSDVVSILSYFMFILYYVYIAVNLFSKDFKVGKEIYFMRFSKLKWSIFKIISLIIILFIVRISSYFVIALLFNNLVIFNCLFSDLVYILFISVISIILLCVDIKWKVILGGILIIFNNLIFVKISEISFFNSLILFFICLFLYLILILFLYKKNTDICERLG